MVIRYDGQTGALIDTFASHGGLSGGPDQNLYVTSYDTGVLRFNGTTGACIDLFSDLPPGGGPGLPGSTEGSDWLVGQ